MSVTFSGSSCIIKKENIESSDFYHKIQDRVHFLPLLEKMLDSNDTVFKYNKKSNVYSMIEADYLMKNHMDGKNLFLFLSNARDDSYFCRSFFSEEKMDYTTTGQAADIRNLSTETIT